MLPCVRLNWTLATKTPISPGWIVIVISCENVCPSVLDHPPPAETCNPPKFHPIEVLTLQLSWSMIEPPMAFVTGELLPAWQLDMGVPTLKLYTAFDSDSVLVKVHWLLPQGLHRYS